MIILNLKSYSQTLEDSFLDDMAAINQFLAENPDKARYVHFAPEQTQLGYFAQIFPTLNIVAQNVDRPSAGSETGWVAAENLLAQKVKYSLLNHSEHRVENLSEKIAEFAENSPQLRLIVCCENIDEAKTLIESNNVFAIAYEPKELIGSGQSVTEYRPEEIKEFINLLRNTNKKAIIGAGVTTAEDVQAALDFGAHGVLLASAFVKANDRLAQLKSYLEVF